MQVWRSTRKEKCYLLNSCFSFFLSGGTQLKRKTLKFSTRNQIFISCTSQNCLHEQTALQQWERRKETVEWSSAMEQKQLFRHREDDWLAKKGKWKWVPTLGNHWVVYQAHSMGLAGGTQAWVGCSNLPLICATVEAFLYTHFQQSFLLHLKDLGSSSAEEMVKNIFVHILIEWKLARASECSHRKGA